MLCQLILLAFVCYAKDYLDGGVNWPEPSCDPSNNPKLSPIVVRREKTQCNQEYLMDMYFFNLGSQEISISYRGDPKTIRISTAQSFSQLFLRSGNSRIASYSLKEIVFRYPPEHKIANDHADVEGQYNYTIDAEFEDIDLPKELTMSIFYVKDDIENTSGLFYSIIKSIGELNMDTVRSTSAGQPIVATIDSLGALNSVFDRPFKFLAYEGTDTDNDCSNERFWILIEERVPLSATLIEAYAGYIKELSSFEGNARIIDNQNEIVVYNCGIKCDEFFEAFLWSFILYGAVLYLIYKFV